MEIEFEAYVTKGIVKNVNPGYASHIWPRTYLIEVDVGKRYRFSGKISDREGSDSNINKLHESELESFTLESFKPLDIQNGEYVTDVEYHIKEQNNDDYYVVIHHLSSTFDLFLSEKNLKDNNLENKLKELTHRFRDF